jgi:hypothetical protein
MADFDDFISRKGKDLHFNNLREGEAEFGDKPSNCLKDDYLNCSKDRN